MNANSLKKLEFNKITNILADFAMSESAKNLCYNLSPENNLEKVSLLLDLLSMPQCDYGFFNS